MNGLIDGRLALRLSRIINSRHLFLLVCHERRVLTNAAHIIIPLLDAALAEPKVLLDLIVELLLLHELLLLVRVGHVLLVDIHSKHAVISRSQNCVQSLLIWRNRLDVVDLQLTVDLLEYLA